MIDMYVKLQDMLEAEIDKIVKDGQITQTSLCNLDTLVDVIKDLEEIKAMQDYGGYSGRDGMMYNDGYSGRDTYGNNSSGNYMRYRNYGRNYDNRSSYGYSQNGQSNYSRDGGKEHMISLMEEAMDHATTKEERDEIMKMIEKLDRK